MGTLSTVDLQEDGTPLWTGDASNFQQGRTDVSNRLQKEVSKLSLDDYESDPGQKITLMNSESLEPRSLSIASLVDRLQPRGPGVNSFLSVGRPLCHFSSLAFVLVVFHIDFRMLSLKF